MRSLSWVVIGLLASLAACTSPSAPGGKSSSSMSEAERVVAERKECLASDVSINQTHVEGVTGGGLAVNIAISSKKTCSLKEPISVLILDANDKPITAGIAVAESISDEGSGLSGEWRNVCSPAVFPLKVALSWASGVVRSPLDSTGLPVCFGEDDGPAERTQPPPSGWLSLRG